MPSPGSGKPNLTQPTLDQSRWRDSGMWGTGSAQGLLGWGLHHSPQPQGTGSVFALTPEQCLAL